MRPIRIACVRYLNTAPLIEGLEKLPELELIPSVPSRMVDHLQRGDADIALASVVDAVRCPTALTLLPVGMIGSDGATLTVRLFSRVPIEEIETIHADSDSHTSVILASLLCRMLHGRTPRIVTYDARERVPSVGEAEERELDEAWPATLLLIGDKVVRDGPPAVRYPYQLDLGEAWHRRTGLPFVYAMWMCRRSDADAPHMQLAAELLDRQRRHNATRLEWIAAQRGKEHRWPGDLARQYLCSFLRYEVSAPAREGVECFVREAQEHGLLSGRALHWWDTDLRRGVDAALRPEGVTG